MAPLRPCHRRVLPCRRAHARSGVPCHSVWACCVATPLSQHKESCRDTNSCRAHSTSCRVRCRACCNAPTPYRRALGTVLQSMSRAVSRHKAVFPFAIQKLYRDTSHAAGTACRFAERTHALLRRIAACLAAPCHDTKFCIVTHP